MLNTSTKHMWGVFSKMKYFLPFLFVYFSFWTWMANIRTMKKETKFQLYLNIASMYMSEL